MVEIEIIDDDEWEPDEDFFVQLYHPGTDNELTGKDTRTKITIIDDDRPGMIVFKEKDTIKAPATKNFAEIVIERVKGSDGRVTVEFETVVMDGGAVEGVDFRGHAEKVEFNNGDTE
jgi:solute carrier family 8 (sodium/calcium exchanger)